MGLDIICIVFVAVFCVLGLLSGFLSQVVRLAALVGAFVLAYSASAYTKPLLVKWMDMDNVMGDLLSLFLGWMACYVAIILIGLTDGVSDDSATHERAIRSIKLALRGQLVNTPAS